VTDRTSGWEWARQARELAVQMLYQWEVGRLSVAEVADSFWRVGEIPESSVAPRVRARARALMAGTIEHVGEIDALLEDASRNWRLDRMPVVDRLVLRLAIYELLHQRATPPPVVIDEALDLVRRFSTEEAVPFVNGVLDAIHRRLAQGEASTGPTAS
jgi:N utilization substance protein B